MPELNDARVAVYIDFDNIVISRYDQVHGRNAWRQDEARGETPNSGTDVSAKLARATVDVSAILDFASSFGTVALSRAYADWSIPANASYRAQLVDRAVDLTQLFAATKAGKNGADIRLSVDVLEDLFRLPDLSHVVIVAGDSDYIALAQRAKRLGRFVIGIGVAGGTSPALIAACDEFELYDAIPGVAQVPDAVKAPRGRARADGAAKAPAAAEAELEGALDAAAAKKLPPAAKNVPVFSSAAEPAEPAETAKLDDAEATRLLKRALELGHAKGDDAEWLNASTVKSQIKRMNPSFNEKLLGFSSFTDFIRSRESIAEVKTDGQNRSIRLKAEDAPAAAAPAAAKKPSRRATKPAG
jgi:hypothetical protein